MDTDDEKKFLFLTKSQIFDEAEKAKESRTICLEIEDVLPVVHFKPEQRAGYFFIV